MLRSEAITIIKRGLGFRATQEATIVAKLQEAQRDLELGRTLPDFLLSFDNPITVTADSPTIAFPTRFIRFHDDYDMYYLSSVNKRVFLPKRNYQEAYQAYIGSGLDSDHTPIEASSDGYPKVVVQRGKTAGLLVPTPTLAFTAYLTCYVGATLLDADIENAWLANAPNVLIALAGMKCAQVVRDKDALTAFANDYKMANAELIGDKVEDELAGRGLVMGRNN